MSTPTSPLPKTPCTFLEAVAREEGFYIAKTRPQRNNNPGDIEWGKFTQAHGATAGDPRFAIFSTPEAGFACMKALFQSSGYKGLTIAQALNRWAPPVENQTNLYIVNVCKWTGLTPDTVIDGILDGSPAPVAPEPVS
ncbi:MAG TPA: hypothetical protein VGC07_06795 [Granulicella sp.]